MSEDAEFAMAEDLLYHLDGLVAYLESVVVGPIGRRELPPELIIEASALRMLLSQARQARKIAQVYYDRVK